MILRVADLHTEHIGKIAKLTEFGVELDKEYGEVFGIGEGYDRIRWLYEYHHCGGPNELSLMFIDEPPIKRQGCVWYCLKDIGKGNPEDWHWFTLNQLMICEEH